MEVVRVSLYIRKFDYKWVLLENRTVNTACLHRQLATHHLFSNSGVAVENHDYSVI